MEIEATAAIVTGGASGLGAATVRRLVKAGAQVVVIDMDKECGREIEASHDGSVTFVAGDIRSPETVEAALDAVPTGAQLRVLVNCAGIGVGPSRTVDRHGTAHEYDAFKLAVDVNLLGTFNVARLAAAHMAKEPVLADGSRGCIVNTASCAAFDGQIGQVAYAAAKAGVVGMTLPLARDLAVLGIRVNTIAPGAFDTPIFGPPSEVVTEFQGRLLRDAAFPERLGDPDEFAALVEHVVRNDYLNAGVIRIDAGMRMRAAP